MIDILVKDLRILVAALSGASTKKQVDLLHDIVSRAYRVVNHLEAELRFEVDLDIFNKRGAEANPPFGAMLINGRVLVCNYRTIVGVWVNGHVKDKSFITREVAIRKVWPKGEKGYE